MFTDAFQFTQSAKQPAGNRPDQDTSFRELHSRLAPDAGGCAPLDDRAGTRTSQVLDKSHLVQSDQLAPRTFGFGHAVDGRAVVSRHIRHTPTVLGWIDFDFRRNPGGGKRLSE